MTALGFKCSESLTLYSTSPRTTLSLRLWFSHMRTFLACVIKHSASSVFLFSWRESLLCNDNLPPPPPRPPLFPSAEQKLEVTVQGRGCRHGIGKYEQRGRAELEGVWAVRAETQHSAAAEGLHCPAVHFQARPAYGVPQGVLWEAGKGLCVPTSIFISSYRNKIHSKLFWIPISVCRNLK